MKPSLLVRFLLGTAIAAQAATLDHTGWFPFLIPWDDTAHTVTDQAWSVDAPAGKYGFLKTTPEGHFRFDGDAKRVRFNGFVNVTSSNYPDSADALLMAARLRKLGTNFLRVHLTDNEWGTALYSSTGTSLAFEPTRMRKMDWFLKCLRDQGIYYNFCIQSARVFRAVDGAPAPVTNDMGKIVSIFDSSLIGIQKEWARMLAQHVNPFTNLAYKDDPAVASWELTNENQLFMAWLSWGSTNQWDSTSTTNANGMHPYYYRKLDSLWNGWLAAKYASDTALERAWQGAVGSGANQIGNTSFESGDTGWGYWYDPNSSAMIAVSVAPGGANSDSALQIEVTSQGDNSYDASINFRGLSCQPGKAYLFRFLVKGSVPTTVRAEFLQEKTWAWYGDKFCTADTGWSVCEAYLSAPALREGDLQVQVDFGHSEGTLRIDSATFREMTGEGLRSGESLVTRSVKRSSRSSLGSINEARAADESRFYSALEAKYVRTLSGFLKDTLGVKVPVTFSNNWFGLPSIASQAKADYQDAHWYWDHPNFSAGWSEYGFSQKNTPMVKDPNWGTIPSFAWSRVQGKPFFASEYNHPWPNQYLCEAPAFYYGYLGFLDADGALLHAYYDSENQFKGSSYRMFFNSGMNPLLVTQQHLARLFRSGAITPATSEIVLDVTESDMSSSARRGDASPFSGASGATLVTPTKWGNFDATASTPTNFTDPGTRAVSNTGELDWNRASGLLRVDNASWQGLVGFLAGSQKLTRLGTAGLKTTAKRNFAAVHLVSADSLPLDRTRRQLLLTSARMENPGTVWNAGFTAITKAAGVGDTTLCEPVTGAVWIRPGVGDSVSVYPLDPAGNRRTALPVNWSGDTLKFTLPGTSLWYEIAKGDLTSPVSIRSASRLGSGLAVRALRHGWEISSSQSGSAVLEWTVHNLSGQVLSQGSRPVGSVGTHRIDLSDRTGMAVLEARLVQESGVIARSRTSAILTR